MAETKAVLAWWGSTYAVMALFAAGMYWLTRDGAIIFWTVFLTFLYTVLAEAVMMANYHPASMLMWWADTGMENEYKIEMLEKRRREHENDNT